MYGKVVSAETCAKLRASQQNRAPVTAEARQKISDAFEGTNIF